MALTEMPDRRSHNGNRSSQIEDGRGESDVPLSKFSIAGRSRVRDHVADI